MSISNVSISLFNVSISLYSKVELNAKLTGSTDIEAGIGELDVNINAPKEDYKIKASKGIGSITIDKEGISDDTIYGNGENYIKIDGGIGSIKITFPAPPFISALSFTSSSLICVSPAPISNDSLFVSSFSISIFPAPVDHPY